MLLDELRVGAILGTHQSSTTERASAMLNLRSIVLAGSLKIRFERPIHAGSGPAAAAGGGGGAPSLADEFAQMCRRESARGGSGTAASGYHPSAGAPDEP